MALSIYRPPTSENLLSFIEELTDCLRKERGFYETFIILGDLNIDAKVVCRELDKLEEVFDLFNLTNLIRYETCFTKDHKSTTDLVIPNKPKCFQNTCITETGLSGFHKLILTFFKIQITRLKPKIIFCRNYKHFEDSRFLEDLNSTDFSLNKDNLNENYNFITEKFFSAVKRHVPLKKKILRSNQALSMTKELKKEICTRSKLKNKYNRNPTEENKSIYKKQRNKMCISTSKSD